MQTQAWKGLPVIGFDSDELSLLLLTSELTNLAPVCFSLKKSVRNSMQPHGASKERPALMQMHPWITLHYAHHLIQRRQSQRNFVDRHKTL